VIIDDADSPAVEGGVYVIGYSELVDGYRHAFYDSRKRSLGGQRVRYSRTPGHPPDHRCPECREAIATFLKERVSPK